jgi:hypothetical protein
MLRHARLTLTAAQFAAVHHCALDLARERGVRRIRVGELLQEAVVRFLEHRGVQVLEERDGGPHV